MSNNLLRGAKLNVVQGNIVKICDHYSLNIKSRAGCLNAVWQSGNIRPAVQISDSLLYCISLRMLVLLSNYILIKLWSEINFPEIVKTECSSGIAAVLATIRSLLCNHLTTAWFSSKNCSVKNKNRKILYLIVYL